MKPYSLDLRQKIVESYENGEGSIRQLAQRFKVSPDFVQRLLKRHRQDGTLEPKSRGGNEPTLKLEHLEILQSLVEADNDATLAHLAQRLAEKTQIKVSASTIHRALKKLGLTRKKKSFKASELYTESKQQQRQEYWESIRAVDPANLVFLDESGVNLAMVELYARSLKGQRAYAERPQKKGKNISILGTMSLKEGFMAGFSFTGALNGDTFVGYVETMLAPQLWPGAVVVMDNLPAHKVQGVEEALTEVRAGLVYFSPYSPDFNPIENLWSKLKAYLRSVAARTTEVLHDAIREGLNLINLDDVRNWFAHCCYCT